MRFVARATFAISVLLAGLVAPGVASADPIPPYYCQVQVFYGGGGGNPNDGGDAWCGGGYGYVRVKIVCANDFNKRVTRYGPWELVSNGAGRPSWQWCYSLYPYVESGAYETRAL